MKVLSLGDSVHENQKVIRGRSRTIILVPYPAQGHVTPMLHLAVALLHHHHHDSTSIVATIANFHVVIVTPHYIHARIHTEYYNRRSNHRISFVPIPDGLDPDEPRDFFNINFAMENNMPSHLEQIIRSFDRDNEGGGVACVIVDLLASWAIDVASRCRVPIVGFWPAMLATYNLIAAIPDMVEQGLISEFGTPAQEEALLNFSQGHHDHHYQPATIKTRHLPWLIGNSSSRKSRFSFWLQVLNRSKSLPCLLINSFPQEHHYEPIIINNYNTKSSTTANTTVPHIFQLGPLNTHFSSSSSSSSSWKNYKNPSFWEEDRSCLAWLDKHDQNSVIYISFGSWVGPIGEDKVKEVALGLEASKKPFIWVLNNSSLEQLPLGFLERTGENIGKIVSWAPQKEVLQHEAIGCYLTHCGWNSTMEAIQCGKPLICYPIAGDQFVNCCYIVKVWGIGVKMEGLDRGEVERCVRKVMEEEGREAMEKKVMELRDRVVCKETSSRAKACLRDFIDMIMSSN